MNSSLSLHTCSRITKSTHVYVQRSPRGWVFRSFCWRRIIWTCLDWRKWTLQSWNSHKYWTCLLSPSKFLCFQVKKFVISRSPGWKYFVLAMNSYRSRWSWAVPSYSGSFFYFSRAGQTLGIFFREESNVWFYLSISLEWFGRREVREAQTVEEAKPQTAMEDNLKSLLKFILESL